MSEGVGFVNTALLEEEHDQPLTWLETMASSEDGRDEAAPALIARGEGGQGRPTGRPQGKP